MNIRKPTTSALLSALVPFYFLYWLYSTGKSMRSHGIDAPKLWLLLAPFIILPLIIVFSVLVRILNLNEQISTVNNVLALLLALGSVLLVFVYHYKFSTATETITNHDVHRITALLLLVFIPPVAVYIVQEKLNVFTQTAQGQQPVTANNFSDIQNQSPPVTPQVPPVVTPNQPVQQTTDRINTQPGSSVSQPEQSDKQ